MPSPLVLEIYTHNMVLKDPVFWSLFIHDCTYYKGVTRERRDDSVVATGVNCGVASSSSWSKSICNPKMRITSIRRLSKTTASIEGELLKRVWTT